MRTYLDKLCDGDHSEMDAQLVTELGDECTLATVGWCMQQHPWSDAELGCERARKVTERASTKGKGEEGDGTS